MIPLVCSKFDPSLRHGCVLGEHLQAPRDCCPGRYQIRVPGCFYTEMLHPDAEAARLWDIEFKRRKERMRAYGC